MFSTAPSEPFRMGKSSVQHGAAQEDEMDDLYLSGSQSTPLNPKSELHPDDGYDYHSVGLVPEDAPTKEREKANISRHRSRYPTRIDPHADTNIALEAFEPLPNLYERESGARRAKIPHEDRQPQRSEAPNIGWKTGYLARKTAKRTTLRHLQLRWFILEDFGARKAILEKKEPAAEPKAHVQDSIIWQYSWLVSYLILSSYLIGIQKLIVWNWLNFRSVSNKTQSLRLGCAFSQSMPGTCVRFRTIFPDN